MMMGAAACHDPGVEPDMPDMPGSASAFAVAPDAG